MNNIIKSQKKSSFWMKIVATTIIIAGAIIGITLGGMHIYQNAKWGSPFSKTYQANVKFSKKEGKVDIDDALNNLHSKINPINQKQISINKISSDELNVTASANMYHQLRDFLRDIERPGSIFFLDQDGNDLLIGKGEKANYVPSLEKDAKRLPLNKLIDQAKTVAGMSNSFSPTVKLKVIEPETFKAITDYLQKKRQTLWIWTDIGAMFDEMRNNYDDFLAFKISITTKIKQLLNEGKINESKELRNAASNLLRVDATHKNPAISKNTIYNIDLFQENDITKISDYFNNYNLDFRIKNQDINSNGADLTVDINNPEYNYDKNTILNPFRPFLKDIVKEVGIVKYSKYVINGNLKNDEITNNARITADDKDNTLFHIPVNGFEKSHILEKVLKVGIKGIIFSINNYGIMPGIISEKAFNIAILIAAIFSALLIIFLIAYYRLAGIIITLMIATSVIVSIVVFNFLSGLYGAEVIIAILVGLAIGIISNIILMERLKEEFSLNKQMLRAFKDSNRKSLSTVFDINIISLLISLILFWFGINMIKSFAIMLIMIILSTMLISILLTRIIFVLLIKTNIFEQKTFLFGDNKVLINKQVKLIKFPKISLNKFNFIKNSKWFAIIAAVIIAVGGIVSLTAGPKNSLDFHSGTIYKINYNSSIGQPGDEEAYNDLSINIKNYITENISSIPYEISKIIDNDTRYFLQLKIGKVNNQQRDALRDYINNINNPRSEVISTNDFEPKSMHNLIINALIAIAIMLGILMIYIFIRFNWSFGLSMIIGVIMEIMLLAAFIVIMRLELTLPLIIVFLGLIIFGIIQKMLLFDRKREILIEYKEQNLEFSTLSKIANQAIILTFKQSLLFLIIMPILILSLLGFGFVNLIILFILGMFITYLTTIFIVSWLFVLFGNVRQNFKQKRLQKIHQRIDTNEIDEQLVSGINS